MVTTPPQPDVEHRQASLSETARTRRQFARFLALLLLPPALAYLATFALVMIPALNYERWGLSKWGPVLEYPFDARQVNADVLIFGDSSAFLGVDPRLVDPQLGVKSVVLPNTIGSISVTGEMGLRRYLAQNRPPRLLVLYFSPWNLNYNQTAGGRFLFEGEEMLFHNAPPAEIASFARQHPLEFLAFPLRLNSTLGPHILRVMAHRPDREAATANARGHVDYTEPYPQFTSPCTFPEPLLSQKADASVQELRRRYSTAETKVVVYLAPVPDCEGASSLADRSFEAISAAPPAMLPASSFAQDGFYAHVRPSAVPAASDLFAKALRRFLEQP